MENKADSFLWQCKINYQKGITPSNSENYNLEDYKKIIALGKDYIHFFGLQQFSFFLRESQYYTPLWAAHIMLNYVGVNSTIVDQCLQTIKEYADHPINIKIAREEKDWLLNNENRYLQ